MKKLIFFITLITCFSGSIFAQQNIVLTGIYQGKDLYVKNPFSDDGVGFCVTEVYVNGNITKDEVNSSAFAIDFSIRGIDIGTPVEVMIRHKSGCEPLILNPDALKPHSSFVVKSITVDDNILTWVTTNERGSLPYTIQQYKWNKWVNVGKVRGNGTPGEHSYQFKLTPYSGENKVRVRQVDYTGKPRYSEAVTYNPGVGKVTFEPTRPQDQIVFSDNTQYEIFNKYGNLVKTGYGDQVDVSQLSSGEYYLNYDASFGETFKKR